MTCYHCKETIRRKDPHAYVPYRVRENGPVHYRRWCHRCNMDDILDKEYPPDYRDKNKT